MTSRARQPTSTTSRRRRSAGSRTTDPTTKIKADPSAGSGDDPPRATHTHACTPPHTRYCYKDCLLSSYVGKLNSRHPFVFFSVSSWDCFCLCSVHTSKHQNLFQVVLWTLGFLLLPPRLRGPEFPVDVRRPLEGRPRENAVMSPNAV